MLHNAVGTESKMEKRQCWISSTFPRETASVSIVLAWERDTCCVMNGYESDSGWLHPHI